MRKYFQTYNPIPFLWSGLLLVTVLACMPPASQSRVRYTPARETSPLSQGGEIPVYVNDSPPGNYSLIGMITVENIDATERNYIARREALERGGDALIAKAPKKEQVREVTQFVDLNRPGGFKIKSKSKVVVTQDYLIIKLEPQETNASYAEREPLASPSFRTPPPSPPVPSAPAAPVPPSEFIDRGDGTVLQQRRGLLWQKCSAGLQPAGNQCVGSPARFTGSEAAAFCTSSQLAGLSWRLPTREELKGLMTISPGAESSQNRQSPLVEEKFFPDTPAGIYWSSDSYSDGKEIAAWVVDFSDTRDYAYYRENKGYTRCVTGAQN